jgi:hypothetical protein
LLKKGFQFSAVGCRLRDELAPGKQFPSLLTSASFGNTSLSSKRTARQTANILILSNNTVQANRPKRLRMRKSRTYQKNFRHDIINPGIHELFRLLLVQFMFNGRD